MLFYINTCYNTSYSIDYECRRRSPRGCWRHPGGAATEGESRDDDQCRGDEGGGLIRAFMAGAEAELRREIRGHGITATERTEYEAEVAAIYGEPEPVAPVMAA